MSNLKKITFYTFLLSACFYWISFAFFDKIIANEFHYMPHTGFLYPFCQFITLLGSPKTDFIFTVVSFILAVFVLYKQPQNRLANHLLLMALAMVVAIFLETTLKYLLGRYRPEMLFQQGLYGFHYLSHQFLLNSTPSGHTTRIFVLVTGFSLMWKRLSPFFIILGLMVAFSRVVLEFHYLSDVVFGAMLGTFATLWISRIYKSLTIASTTTLLSNN
jgi:membrane-associated phospholipid phosphatase